MSSDDASIHHAHAAAVAAAKKAALPMHTPPQSHHHPHQQTQQAHKTGARRAAAAEHENGSESGSYRSLSTSVRWRQHHRSVANSNAGGLGRGQHYHHYHHHQAPPPPRVEVANTYRLGPDPDRRFNAASVAAVTRRLLADELRDVRHYDARDCGRRSLVLCERIKHAVKELDFPRYKIVCNVVLGEKIGQGVHVRSRGVWDDRLDRFAEATFENGSLYAVATVYGVYFE